MAVVVQVGVAGVVQVGVAVAGGCGSGSTGGCDPQCSRTYYAIGMCEV